MGSGPPGRVRPKRAYIGQGVITASTMMVADNLGVLSPYRPDIPGATVRLNAAEILPSHRRPPRG
jgi:hypothetical protein